MRPKMTGIVAPLVTMVALTVANGARGGEKSSLAWALDSITVDDVRRHVEALSNDTFEGREAGSRGGRAAGVYLERLVRQPQFVPAGGDGSFFQPFGNGYRNILARFEGSDERLKNEVIVVGAHYDHVGYGNRQNSNGPIGYIHNGADDNASGAAALLEAMETFARLPSPPRRSILFAFWDGEEKGLLGSQHWASHPTMPLAQVPLVVNLDMVGRLRNDRLEVYGTRTTRGLRRLFSSQNADANLRLDFTWEMADNSDHYTFYQRSIPIVMLHTGLHDDYHRPSDDVEKVNFDGVRRVGRLLVSAVYELADRPDRPEFRAASRTESVAEQRAVERALPPLPGRLGIQWSHRSEAEPALRVTHVAARSAADRAGIRAGDRIMQFANREITSDEAFVAQVLAAENPIEVQVERDGATEPIMLSVLLDGVPVRLGISWRVDDAEPGCIVVSRVVPGSPAAHGGVRVNDRICAVNSQSFSDGDDFRRLIAAASGDTLDLEVEREGRIQTVPVDRTTVLDRQSP